ncbi:MAG: hypothetical protein QOH72_3318 [Solirubrobacteraceae bacterium]|jgi:hypothetical protein|nr:hypothetical protein [Solirubrobacteraceae bacterium]
MTATTAERQRVPEAPATSPPPGASGRRDAPMPDDEWRELMRALTATDDDELPLFGRFPA